jgi:hypothetical protein
MFESFVEVNSLKIQVLSWGHEISDSFDGIKEIVLFFPGAAGIPEYYCSFLQTIYEKLNREVPIFACSHSGFVEKNGIKYPELEENENLYTGNGNIKHKVCNR